MASSATRTLVCAILLFRAQQSSSFSEHCRAHEEEARAGARHHQIQHQTERRVRSLRFTHCIIHRLFVHSIAYLAEHRLIENSPESIANFLLTTEGTARSHVRLARSLTCCRLPQVWARRRLASILAKATSSTSSRCTLTSTGSISPREPSTGWTIRCACAEHCTRPVQRASILPVWLPVSCSEQC